MAKTKQQKQEHLEDLTNRLGTAKAAVFANFQGLTVPETEALRKECRDNNVTVIASKKTLLRNALANAGHDVDTKAFEGGVAAIFGNEDEVAAAQIVANFAKDHEVVTIFGGVLEGNYIDAAKVTELSKLPSKQQLLGQLVGTLNAPISGFANVLAGNIRGLVTVLNGIKEAKA